MKPSLAHPPSSQISKRLPGVPRPRQSQLTAPSGDAVKEFKLIIQRGEDFLSSFVGRSPSADTLGVPPAASVASALVARA